MSTGTVPVAPLAKYVMVYVVQFQMAYSAVVALIVNVPGTV